MSIKRVGQLTSEHNRFSNDIVDLKAQRDSLKEEFDSAEQQYKEDLKRAKEVSDRQLSPKISIGFSFHESKLLSKKS